MSQATPVRSPGEVSVADSGGVVLPTDRRDDDGDARANAQIIRNAGSSGKTSKAIAGNVSGGGVEHLGGAPISNRNAYGAGLAYVANP